MIRRQQRLIDYLQVMIYSEHPHAFGRLRRVNFDSVNQMLYVSFCVHINLILYLLLTIRNKYKKDRHRYRI